MIEHLWWLLLFSIIPSCLSKVKVSPITRTWLSTFTWKLWLSFVFLTELNGWAFVYEISGCGIDYCYSYVNFRYHAYFEQGAPWYPDNYRVYIHSKTWLWHDKKNTQLKNFLPLYTVLLIYSKVKASQILHGKTTQVAPSKNWIKAISIHQIRKIFPVFHIYLVVKKSQEKPCLPDWFPVNIPLVIEILFPTTFVTEWTSIGYCKTSHFFLANISSTFFSIIGHYEIPTFLVDEQESRWIL